MPETKVKKTEDFNEWYNEIVELAGLCDKRYPIKGMNVWMPYGWKLMRHVDDLIREEMIRTGHEEVCFPLLIPESLFKKEEEHIKGFSSEVYWVTHAGSNKLEERWLLRPTSETAMYPIFALWVRSHTDLPLKVFQIVNTFRYETKQTRAFIRVREIHFFEAHTCHVDFEDAERQIVEDKEIAGVLMKKLSLPCIFNKRPNWDKFAGACYTISIDVLMPSGRTLQVGSIHQYKQNFSKPYNISYETMDGKHEFCYQTTYGMSERLLGAIIGVHGDDKGLVLPPEVAPVQVIIIPIIFKGKEEEINKACETLCNRLRIRGIRAEVDQRECTPGNKFYDWELKGVPLRVEIGPRDVDKGECVIVRRDTGERRSVQQRSVEETIELELKSISDCLYNNAKKLLDDGIHHVTRIEDAVDLKGIVEVPWCRDEACALEVEKFLDCNTLGEPVDEKGCDASCPICGRPADTYMRYAKMY
ncbi:MAG: proline--tRNA ligase [Candidatus Thermoplasmatota archaeon]